MFNRTKAAIARGKEVRDSVKAAPANAQAAATAAASSLGRRIVNGKAHCPKGGGSRGQHEPTPPKKENIWTHESGQRYQLLMCRHCEGVMSAIKIGSKR